MGNAFSYMKEQYDLVRQSRQALHNYCKSVSSKDLVAENSSFGRGGSIRNLLVHIANTYEFWIGKHAMKKETPFTGYDSCENVNDIISLFASVDELMSEFFSYLEQHRIDEICYKLKGTTNVVTPLGLFTHVITHEFHHKGQILTLSRHLGYIPVDTDIVR